MTTKGFATAINCMDGRVQDSVNQYMKNKFSVDFVDVITEPGPNRILAQNIQTELIKNIKYRVDISVQHHKSKGLCIVGHHDCAGNPVSDEEQIKNIKDAIKTIKSWKYAITVIGLWIRDDWKINEIT